MPNYPTVQCAYRFVLGCKLTYHWLIDSGLMPGTHWLKMILKSMVGNGCQLLFAIGVGFVSKGLKVYSILQGPRTAVLGS